MASRLLQLAVQVLALGALTMAVGAAQPAGGWCRYRPASVQLSEPGEVAGKPVPVLVHSLSPVARHSAGKGGGTEALGTERRHVRSTSYDDRSKFLMLWPSMSPSVLIHCSGVGDREIEPYHGGGRYTRRSHSRCELDGLPAGPRLLGLIGQGFAKELVKY